MFFILITNCELRITDYELQIMNYEMLICSKWFDRSKRLLHQLKNLRCELLLF
jgi:hypothetical protein